MKAFAISVITILVAALIALGFFYGLELGKLDKANTQVTTLEANVASLQDELTAAQANVTGIQTQLNAEVTKSAASDAKVTSLTADLAAANAKVASTQAGLDKANADLTAAKASNTSLSAELTKVKDPRHFNTVQELTDWLAKDDTNTNSAYSQLTTAGRAYVLEVKALRDGFILPVQISWDATHIYAVNVALVGPDIYAVNAVDDVITKMPTSFASALPSHPLPLP